MTVMTAATAAAPSGLRSMTGFGRAEGGFGPWTVLVEVKSVNHRGQDVRVRVPPGLGSLGLEEALRQRVAAAVRRGSVAMSVHLMHAASPAGGAADVDAVAQHEVAVTTTYFTALHAQAQALGAPPPRLDVVWAALHASQAARRDVAATPGPSYRDIGQDAGLSEAILATADRALAELAHARTREGGALAQDLQALRAQLGQRLRQVAALAPAAPGHAAAQFAARMRQLGASELTAERIATEAAALAARMDIHEELTRADAHLQAFDAQLHAPAAGRRLDFLAQELHREFSTMGAKSSDSEIISALVAAKAELDRIREQVQNVE